MVQKEQLSLVFNEYPALLPLYLDLDRNRNSIASYPVKYYGSIWQTFEKGLGTNDPQSGSLDYYGVGLARRPYNDILGHGFRQDCRWRNAP